MSGALQEAQEREKLDVSRHVKVQQTEIADGNSTYSQWVPNVTDIFGTVPVFGPLSKLEMWT